MRNSCQCAHKELALFIIAKREREGEKKKKRERENDLYIFIQIMDTLYRENIKIIKIKVHVSLDKSK